MINSFDIDGVIYMGEYDGLYPGKDDVIITGRSVEESFETDSMLLRKGIRNRVFYNLIPFNQKTRKTSGQHKADIINMLLASGMKIGIHFEDDPIQAQIIQENVKGINLVLVTHDLVEKENVRHK